MLDVRLAGAGKIFHHSFTLRWRENSQVSRAAFQEHACLGVRLQESMVLATRKGAACIKSEEQRDGGARYWEGD